MQKHASYLLQDSSRASYTCYEGTRSFTLLIWNRFRIQVCASFPHRNNDKSKLTTKAAVSKSSVDCVSGESWTLDMFCLSLL